MFPPPSFLQVIGSLTNLCDIQCNSANVTSALKIMVLGNRLIPDLDQHPELNVCQSFGELFLHKWEKRGRHCSQLNFMTQKYVYLAILSLHWGRQEMQGASSA